MLLIYFRAVGGGVAADVSAGLFKFTVQINRREKRVTGKDKSENGCCSKR